MKINVRAFTIAFTVVLSVTLLVISVWTRSSASFGRELMDVFNSVHPHPFRASLEGLTLAEHFYGAALDLFYTIVDCLIFSLSFSMLYNWIVSRSENAAGDASSRSDAELAGRD